MHGAITWHELITSDIETATGFYTELLGLELETADMGDFQYPMLKKDGRTHAGFVRNWNQEPPTAVFAWDELHATDVEAAADFYGSVAGWTTSRAPA